MPSDPSHHIEGSVTGDAVSGDKTVTQTAGGDIVGGDKITHTGTGHIFTGSGDVLIVQPQLSPANARELANLRVLLSRVKTFWIGGVLERSVHTAFLVELGREMRTDAIDHPWASVLELPDTTSRPLPNDVSDLQVFDGANRALLILGEPGAGKTTTMLEIARDLITRAEQDAEGVEPIPIVVNLSGWHSQRLPIAAWLVAELASKYQIPSRLGRAWLDDHRLLPLFDGLDEVDPAFQPACVSAINQFTATQAPPGLVVCCRTAEYTRLPARLRLNGAICLSPLSSAQVDAYLEAGGAHTAALRSVIRSDEVLASLGQTPLLLSLMCLAYQDLQPGALAAPETQTLDERRRQLFAQFTARMLKRKGMTPGRVSDERLVAWLSWLARQMSAHSQTAYVIDRMQPSWIRGRIGQWAYALASRAGAWWVIGWSMALTYMVAIAALAIGLDQVAQVIASGELDLVGNIRAFANPFAWAGVIAALVFGLRFELAARRASPLAGRRTFWRAAANVAAGSLIPIAVGLGPLFVRISQASGDTPLIAVLRAIALCTPLLVVSAVSLRTWETGDSLAGDIAPLEPPSWSWTQSLKGAAVGFIGGAFVALACGLTLVDFTTGSGPWGALVSSALPAGTVGAAAIGLISGLRSRELARTPDNSHWLKRHVRRSLGAGLFVGGITGLAGALGLTLTLFLEIIAGLYTWRELILALGFGLACALTFATVAAMYVGGYALIQHLVLRLILFAQRRLPLRLSPLTAQAEDLVFLRQVGGGYIFIHRLVQDYFASLPSK